MTLNIYNFKLYYPDDMGGGDGGEGEGESEGGEEAGGGLPTVPGASDSTISSYGRGKKRKLPVEDKPQFVNKTGASSWTTNVNNEAFNFDTQDGPGPVTNTNLDIEKRAEARGAKIQRVEKYKEYGDDYSGDGDDWGKEKRGKVKRKDYGKPISPKTTTIEFKKEITSYTVQGIDHDRSRPISQKGETRAIKLSGTPGSVFTITIKDSEDCSILDRELNNIEIPRNGKYVLKQHFPSIYSSEGVARTQQYYDIELTIAPDVYVSSGVEKLITVYQYKDPTITFSKTYTETNLPTLTLAGGDVSVTGGVKEKGNTKKTYELTIQEEDATRLYVKDRGFKNNLVASTSFTKKVDRCGNTGAATVYQFDTITTRSSVVDGKTIINDVIKGGMQLTCDIIKSKSVLALLDKDQNIIQTGSCSDKKVNKFKLTDTNELVVGMDVIFETGETSTIQSIDCAKNITINSLHELNCNATITFMSSYRAKVISTQNASSGNKPNVMLDRSIDIPHRSIVTFDDDKTILKGYMQISGSGNTAADTANQLKLTAELDIKKFGFRDVTYSFDLDKILSIKPNAYNQNIVISKDSSGYVIDMIKYDKDTNKTDKTGVVVKSPSHGSLSAYSTSNDTFTYTPNKGFVGKDFFTFQMRDSASQLSELRTICIKVLGVSNPVDSQKPRDPRSGGGYTGEYTTLLS